jgi:inorganic pyrophosphatase
MPDHPARVPFSALEPFDPDSGELNAVVETPRGSRNKYSLDEQTGVFKLKAVLTAGAAFPFDFGFIPGTVGEDGDPLDVLIIMDEPTFPGCLVPAHLIGVIEARQTSKDGKTERNDRLIALAADSQRYSGIRSITELSRPLLDEIEEFFAFYNRMRGKKFKPLGRKGPRKAAALVKAGVRKKRAETRTNGRK